MEERSPPGQTTPHGIIRYASEFYQAARAVDDTVGRKIGYEIVAPIPALFLIAQSIELSLKALLLNRGVPLEKLKHKYGHNLRRALRKAKEFGLLSLVSLTPDEERLLGLLDDLYSSKQLQYIVTGMKTFPSYGILEGVAMRLLEAIAEHVKFPKDRLPHAL
jgi:hypothetical protein